MRLCILVALGAAGSLARIDGGGGDAAVLAAEDTKMVPSAQRHAKRVRTLGQSCNVRGTEPVRLAVLMYGLFRNLSSTQDSIATNLIAPARAFANGAIDVWVHENEVDTLKNVRSGEQASTIDQSFAGRIPDLCGWQVEVQDDIDAAHHLVARANATFAKFAPRFPRSVYPRDKLGYDAPTFVNLYRSRYSAWQVATLVQKHEREAGWQYTHAIFARPDTALMSPVGLSAALLEGADVLLPNFAMNLGLNDRFAFGRAEPLLRTMGSEFNNEAIVQVIDGGPLTNCYSEEWLCRHAISENVTVGVMPVAVVRVRSGGELVNRDFGQPRQQPNECVALGLRFRARPESDLAMPDGHAEPPDSARLDSPWGCTPLPWRPCPQPEPEPDPELQPQPQPQPESEPQPQPESEPQPQRDCKPLPWRPCP